MRRNLSNYIKIYLHNKIYNYTDRKSKLIKVFIQNMMLFFNVNFECLNLSGNRLLGLANFL